jgi:hypothetical protein
MAAIPVFLFISYLAAAAAASLRAGHQGHGPDISASATPEEDMSFADALSSKLVSVKDLSATESEKQKPMLIFLFLVYDRVNNEEIWNRFFASATHGSEYRALVHCKYPDACRTNIKSQHRFIIIPSVETKYCTDLVSGMNALLQSAMTYTSRGGMDADKFIIVSDTTITVKPFLVVQDRLLSTGTDSHFCIFPRNEWAETQETKPGWQPSVQAAVKAHQWIILSRPRVKQVLARSHEHRDLMNRFYINSMGPVKNTGCLDEYWYFAILFGTVSHATNPQTLQMTGLTGRPLSTTDYEIQGQCDTFVQWIPRASGTINNMTMLTQYLTNDPGVDMTAASAQRPAAFHRFSLNSVVQLRQSWFLFARKVDDGATFAGCDLLVDVFDKVIFSEPPQHVQPAPPFAGSGKWADAKNLAVTVTSSGGSLQLKGKSLFGLLFGRMVELIGPDFAPR